MKTRAFASFAIVLAATSVSASPPTNTREEIMTRGAPIAGFSYWWGHGRWNNTHTSLGSCSGGCPSCSHSGSYGADCSGFVAKAWQVPSASSVTTDAHPYSTYNFKNQNTHWTHIARGSVTKADALVHNSSGSGHVVLFDRGDPWGSMVTYECKGCSYGCVHQTRTASSAYVGIRRNNIGAPPPANRAPRGHLDKAACNGVDGWAQDQDVDGNAIPVHLSFDGAAGATGATSIAVTANVRRDDLCTAISSCNHGFHYVVPARLRDGRTHTVHAYGVDSASGAKTLLAGAPQSFSCAAPAPALAPTKGVRRHVPNPAAFTAWKFTADGVATLPDDVVAAFVDGEPLAATPHLVKTANDATVWLADDYSKRAVPSPAAMAAWHFDFAAVGVVSAAEVARLLTAHALPDAPFVFKGSGPAIYVLDHPPPLGATWLDVSFPDDVVEGETADVRLTAKNTGSASWTGGLIHVGTTQPRDSVSTLCDSGSWLACNRPAALVNDAAPGETGEFLFKLRAPANTAGTTVRLCVGLLVDGMRWFSMPGLGGPADDALCRDVSVVSAPAPVISRVPPGAPAGSGGGGAPDEHAVSVGTSCVTSGPGGWALWLVLAVCARRRPLRKNR